MHSLRYVAIAGSLFFSVNLLAENDTQALIQQGYAQTQAGQLDAALQTLQEALSRDPDSSLVHTRLGGVRLLRQEYRTGIEDFQRAIMLDQNNAAAFIGMAVAYLHMGQHSLAQAALNEAAKLDPSKQAEIDKVMAWIEQRSKGAATAH